jgi:hypothetical protein
MAVSVSKSFWHHLKSATENHFFGVMSANEVKLQRKGGVEMANGNGAKAIAMAGLACGVLDIIAALVVYGSMGLKPLRLLQGIAAGVLGPKSFQGGIGTALLGLALHVVIAFGAATVYYAASRGMRILVEQAALCGALYGVAVYFFMNRIVVPLSGATKYPFSVKMLVIGVVIHIFCVGLPIALSIRRFGN